MDEQLWHLHLRKALGEQLSDEERSRLDAWYIANDRIESAMLSSSAVTDGTATFKTQLEATLGQIAFSTQQIKQINEENERLRLENATLRRQLVQRTLLQPV